MEVARPDELCGSTPAAEFSYRLLYSYYICMQVHIFRNIHLYPCVHITFIIVCAEKQAEEDNILKFGGPLLWWVFRGQSSLLGMEGDLQRGEPEGG